MGKWQPIETAPKDGTRVLAYWNGCFVDNKPYRDEYVVVQYHSIRGWHDAGNDEEYGEPDLWMPLPEPPK